MSLTSYRAAPSRANAFGVIMTKAQQVQDHKAKNMRFLSSFSPISYASLARSQISFTQEDGFTNCLIPLNFLF